MCSSADSPEIRREVDGTVLSAAVKGRLRATGEKLLKRVAAESKARAAAAAQSGVRKGFVGGVGIGKQRKYFSASVSGDRLLFCCCFLDVTSIHSSNYIASHAYEGSRLQRYQDNAVGGMYVCMRHAPCHS